MTTESCEHFRGLIAMEVVGQISVAERVALTAHTDGCAACRDERHDLGMLSFVLPEADPNHFEHQKVPFGLQTAVLERLRVEDRRDRRRRRARYAIGSAAAAIVAVVALTVALIASSGPTTTTTTVELYGPPSVHATVRLTAQPWGTAMELRESGQPAGQVLSVSMRTKYGSWWQTGTYETAGTSVRVSMACALKLSQIVGVWVHDMSGHIVMHGTVGSHLYDAT